MSILPSTVWSSQENNYFGLAIGQTGPQGVQGPVGPTGLSVGLPGVPGPAGPPGGSSSGPTGATGPRGLEGPFGPQGNQGTSAGASGPTGPSGVVGPRGSSGIPGEYNGGIPYTIVSLSGLNTPRTNDPTFTYGTPAPGILNVPVLTISGSLYTGADGTVAVSRANSNSSFSSSDVGAPLVIASVDLTSGNSSPALNTYGTLIGLCSVQIQNSQTSVFITTDQALMNIGVQIDGDGNNAVYGGSVYCPAKRLPNSSGYNIWAGTGGSAVILVSNVHYTSNSQQAQLVIQSQPSFPHGWPGAYSGNFSVFPI